ncbi:IS5 family transposase [Endozoicomonas sp.]|uniref:IS5 family transposase n=1 Tax=Endozoicomonas sp. TaxID=1892382 RepID=UPI003AF9DF9C
MTSYIIYFGFTTARTVLNDDQWNRVKDILPGIASDSGTTAANNRLFVEAVLWIARTGAPWRDLPEQFGSWHNVYNRYSRWCSKGIWEKAFKALSSDSDMEYLMVDGSIVRVHQHGAPEKGALSI